MLCKDCNTDVRYKTFPRCHKCHKVRNAQRARQLRCKYKTELLVKNDKLKLRGKRICERCLKIKLVTEFETSMGNRKGKLNKICDCCLSKMYSHPNRQQSEFTYGFWRRRAYSLNSTARHRLIRENRHHIDITNLPHIFKPQELIHKYNQQDGKCRYCNTNLTPDTTSADHQTPLSCGGNHSNDNVVLSCSDCNRLKHTRTADGFLTFVYEYAKRFAEVVESKDKEP